MLLSFDSLENIQMLKERTKPLLQTLEYIHMRVSVYIDNLFGIQTEKNKRKSQNVCRHQTLEIHEKIQKKKNDEHLV